MEADQLGRVRDMLQAARLIATYVHGVTEAEFRADTLKQDAVIRRIAIIGEAAAHLTPATRKALSDLPFRKIRGMRNILVHDYGGVDPRIVWEVATIHVPEVRAVLEEFFGGQA